jgi:Secretion system C-terminal sorting domain
MTKKFLPIMGLILTAAFVIGMVTLDPNGSRSPNVETSFQEPVISQTDMLEKYIDNFDGANDSNSLKARGYKLRRGALCGPPGSNNGWFQGNSTVFPAYNGPSTGYVAANYNTVSGANTIDLWLISPVIDAGAGDSIIFYERGPTSSTFPDSIRVHWAANGDTNASTGSWVELGKFKATITGSWAQRLFIIPTASATGRLAINYRVVDGGPAGQNSDFIGIDYLRVIGPSTVGITTTNGEVPTKYALGQNYPNPFNPSTNINFSLPTSGVAKLTVFDVSGKVVATLLNGEKTAGNYTADFDASRLSSGVYFYRLESGNFTQTKKMLLVK